MRIRALYCPQFMDNIQKGINSIDNIDEDEEFQKWMLHHGF